MEKKKEFWRAVKFVLFSASAGIIEIVVFALLNELLRLPYWLSYLAALVASVLWNFTLNRKFTFQSANNVPKAMLQVALFYAVFTPLSTLLEHVLTEKLGWNEFKRKRQAEMDASIARTAETEYLYDRYVVFRDSIDTNERAKKQAEEEK